MLFVHPLMNLNIKVSIIVIATLITGMIVSISPSAFSQTTTSGNEGNVHLGAAVKALQSGNTSAALMHMNQADKIITGAAKMHLDAAISALQSGDKSGAMMHLQQSQKSQ